VTIQLEGDQVRAYEGESVAVALFASGVEVLSRSVKYHRPRTFFCLDGHCAACFMRVDGVPNLRSCREPVREGLACERQNALPSATWDVLAAADWLFPKGMDHHTLLAKQPLLRPVLHKVVRELGGLGHLADEAPKAIPKATRRNVEVLVVGGGPAGLACAAAAAKRGRKVVLVDENDRFGGSLLAEPKGDAETLEHNARAAGVELISRATALAWFPEENLLAVQTPMGLQKITAEKTVYATGAYDQNILCENNDRPGVFAGRAVGRLLLRYGVRPGTRIAVVGRWGYAERLAPALEAAGIGVVRAPEIARVHGKRWVESVELPDDKREECDAVAACAEPLPASELARQHGAHVKGARGAFAVETDGGATSRAGVFACGDVTGAMTPARATEDGAALGERL
jgi:sarcosine oxidase subunit alpha